MYNLQVTWTSIYFFLALQFYFRGCGWQPKKMNWTSSDKEWISKIDSLLTAMFGPDNFNFVTDALQKVSKVDPDQIPKFSYDHDKWEQNNHLDINETKGQTEATKKRKYRQDTTSIPNKVHRTEEGAHLHKLHGMPEVPRGGGSCTLPSGILIKLVNTCPIDNVLTACFFCSTRRTFSSQSPYPWGILNWENSQRERFHGWSSINSFHSMCLAV